MTGRIVVGIDGSEQSGNALEWAVARARLGGEKLELVNAYNITPDLDFYGYHGAASQPVEWLLEFSEQVLDAAAARVRELAPDLACTLTSKMGHPAHTLAAASEAADAVVVGRRGLGSAASALLGSVSNRLTIQAKCPLVVVREGELPTTGPIVVRRRVTVRHERAPLRAHRGSHAPDLGESHHRLRRGAPGSPG
jgi:nucleotide-binding universal stress UspA family protein